MEQSQHYDRQAHCDVCRAEAKDTMKRQRRWACFGNRTRSMKTLPEVYRVTGPACNPPVFQYGFGLTFQRLIDYALQHHIVEVPENPENDDPEDIRGGLIIFSLCDVTQYLQRLCRLPLTYVNPISLDYDVVIAMYSNYTQEDRELEDEDHAEVVQQMGEELGCPEGPMWYLDSH
ncbi:hypothetical protein EV421DRAFT_1840546 [Armillaria borealis]|uniref:Uncharacterized protein n=1 Tax=Armillaria borealis TaxID=47425 RepID=A0AA39J1B3_9AGAR|nr:hypothetical protein EV421DRAFT_1840546 [Armillaria borealis]